MGKKIIVVGEPTNHGSLVISGSGLNKINGKGIAKKIDQVSCPLLYPDKRPHGVIKLSES